LQPSPAGTMVCTASPSSVKGGGVHGLSSGDMEQMRNSTHQSGARRQQAGNEEWSSRRTHALHCSKTSLLIVIDR
jgi:hypothetical protein